MKSHLIASRTILIVPCHFLELASNTSNHDTAGVGKKVVENEAAAAAVSIMMNNYEGLGSETTQRWNRM